MQKDRNTHTRTGMCPPIKAVAAKAIRNSMGSLMGILVPKKQEKEKKAE